MRRLPFSRLLLLIALVPTLALAVLVGRFSYESWTRYSDLTRANSLLRLAVAASRFGGIGIPDEGGATRVYLAGGDRAKLMEVRSRLDGFYQAMRDAAAANAVADPGIGDRLSKIEQLMPQLRAMRQKIEDKTVTAGDTSGANQVISAECIDLVERTGAIVGDPVLARRITGLYATLQLNSAVLVQRGFVQRALQDGQLPTATFASLVKAASLQNAFSKMFYDYAPGAVVADYRAFLGRSGKAVDRLQSTALANSGKPADAADVKQWLDINVEQSALFGRLVSDSTDLISAEAAGMLSAAWNETAIYSSIGVVVLVFVVLITYSVLRTVRGLLGGLSGVMDEMSAGHYGVAVPSTERKDEIGVMARATEGFRENLLRMRAMEAEQKESDARRLAEQHAAAEREAAQKRAAEEEAKAERTAAMQALAQKFEAAIGEVVSTVSSASLELEAAAGKLTETAQSTEHLSGSVAAASEQASANVASVASATDELTGSVQEISRQVAESSRIAGEAVKQAHKTDARIAQLAEAAGRIGDVVKLITAIAEQTNLLALNATIEAARAGEAGKGFAVVAQEVKALAAQTAKATDEIGTQIAGMQSATQDSVSAMKEIGATIARISEIAGAVAVAVDQQGAATHEISRNVQQAADGTAEVARHITQVSRGAKETGSASAQVLSSAKALAQESHVLGNEVERFLATVRAA